MHGGDIYSREIELDYSVNINPLGMPEKVHNSIIRSAAAAENYPDITCRNLRDRLSEYCGIPSDNIVCGNGASELIHAVCQMLRPRKALIVVPGFSGYERSLSLVGADIEYIRLSKESGFTETEGKIADVIRSTGPEMVILACPNNPNGSAVGANDKRDIIEACNEAGAHLVVDECFVELSDCDSFADCLNYSKGMVIIRAFTKSFAMAGIRLGYGLCSDKTIADCINSYLPEWNVSVIAQNAGIAALEDIDELTGYLTESVSAIRREREYLSDRLSDFGFEVFPSKANYILFKDLQCTGTEPHINRNLSDLLLEKKILIRDCSDYEGLEEGYYRVAVKKHDDNVKLIKAMEDILAR